MRLELDDRSEIDGSKCTVLLYGEGFGRLSPESRELGCGRFLNLRYGCAVLPLS